MDIRVAGLITVLLSWIGPDLHQAPDLVILCLGVTILCLGIVQEAE